MIQNVTALFTNITILVDGFFLLLNDTFYGCVFVDFEVTVDITKIRLLIAFQSDNLPSHTSRYDRPVL
jgi:hypothetical protein